MVHPLTQLQDMIREESNHLGRLVDECWNVRGVSDERRNEMAGEAYAFFEPRINSLQARLMAICGKDNPDAHSEVDLYEILVERVRAGEPIHITGPLDGSTGQLNLATIAKLRAETGLPVRVVYN